MRIWRWEFFEWGELGQSRENWDASSQFSPNQYFYFECFLHKMYYEDIRNTLAYLRQTSLTPDAKWTYRSLHWINGKQNYSVTPKNRSFYSTSISRHLATRKGSRSVVMCANCFHAEKCEKEVLSPIGRPDTEVLSLLQRPNSPHSPLEQTMVAFPNRASR